MKWYELSERDRQERIATARQYWRDMSDIELLKHSAWSSVDTLTMWMNAEDTAACIARDAELYERNLLGPARRIVPEFEQWYALHFGPPAGRPDTDSDKEYYER